MTEDKPRILSHDLESTSQEHGEYRRIPNANTKLLAAGTAR